MNGSDEHLASVLAESAPHLDVAGRNELDAGYREPHMEVRLRRGWPALRFTAPDDSVVTPSRQAHRLRIAALTIRILRLLDELDLVGVTLQEAGGIGCCCAHIEIEELG